MKKRFLSLFLSVVIALSVFSVLPITASGEETQNTYTVAGKTTGYVSDGVATGTTAPEVKTHSIVGTIAPDGWNPQGEANLMTLNGDAYEFEITGVKADTYTFKITTNGQWDPAYDFDGKIASGGSDETIIVPEDNSTVKFTFKEKDGFVRAYINGVDYLSGFNTYNTPHTTSKGGYYIPYEGTKTYRYFFEMPESWKTFANATACCYWWEGTDNCDKTCVANPDYSGYKTRWKFSYMMRKADVPNRDNIYFIDVPQDVHRITFNNGIDIGTVIYDDNGNKTYKNYGKVCQTELIKLPYSDGEYTYCPDGLDSFDNMIFVVNQDDATVDSISGTKEYNGEWKYLHQDGSIDSTKGTILEQDTSILEKALAENIKVYPYADSVYIGKKITLEAVVFPNDADKRVTWKSSDINIATVDSNGVVTGKSMGEVTISATTTDGTNLVDTFDVTVKEPIDFIKCLNYKVNEDKKSITITNYRNNSDYDFEEIVIPETIDGYAVTDIGEKAFAHKSFNTVKLNEGLKTIGTEAFFGTALSSITIPKSVTSIGEDAIGYYQGWEGYGDSDEGEYYIGRYNTTFYAYRGSAGWKYASDHYFTLLGMGYEKTVTNSGFKYNLYNDGTADLIEYIGNSSYVNVPSKVSNHTVVGICRWTFFDNNKRNILSITIPNTVERIDAYAMRYCDSLKKVVIPKSVKNLENFSVGGGGYDDFDDTYELMTNFTIYGYKGSDAEKYAKKYHINFIDMGTSISFKKNPVTIYKTGTYTIKPIVKYGKGTTTYKSDNTKVATVNGKGVVTAKKVGKAKITVTNNGVKKVLKVTVKNPYLNKTPKTLKLGKNFTLKINGQVGKAKFTHSKKDIVSVKPIKGKSNQYKVTAKKKGTTTITIKTNGITLKCKVTVI